MDFSGQMATKWAFFGDPRNRFDGTDRALTVALGSEQELAETDEPF